MKKLIALALTGAFAAAVYASQYPNIEIKELKSAIAAKTVTILDVNGTESWQKGHIPGAIDFEANKEKMASLLPKDKGALVVAYCGGPACGAYQAAAKAAEKLGYTNVKHLTAGISGWRGAGEPTEPGTPAKTLARNDS
jgi:rhodanese-related sulfurtransferase